MKKFGLDISEVFNILKFSTVVDVEERGREGTQQYYIRKRTQVMHDEVAEIFGFNIETVK